MNSICTAVARIGKGRGELQIEDCRLKIELPAILYP
jgi:hypothetical protein